MADTVCKSATEKRRQIQQLGCVFGILLSICGSVLLWKGHSLVSGLLFGSAIFVTIAFWLVWPGTGRVFSAWMAMAVVMSKVSTPVILTIFYLLVVTPIGLLGRLFGQRFIDKDFKQGCDSYWIKRKSVVAEHDGRKQY